MASDKVVQWAVTVAGDVPICLDQIGVYDSLEKALDAIHTLKRVFIQSMYEHYAPHQRLDIFDDKGSLLMDISADLFEYRANHDEDGDLVNFTYCITRVEVNAPPRITTAERDIVKEDALPHILGLRISEPDARHQDFFVGKPM